MPIHNRISILALPQTYQRIVYMRDVQRKRWREIAAELDMCMSDAQRRYQIVQDEAKRTRAGEKQEKKIYSNLLYGKNRKIVSVTLRQFAEEFERLKSSPDCIYFDSDSVFLKK